MSKLKLSELDDDVQIASELFTRNYSVREIKHEILNLREPHHTTTDWHVVNPVIWKPDAKYMLECYIESIEHDMFEDWGEQAWNCITDEVTQELQNTLDKAFSSDEYVTNYWEFDFNKPVEIDLFPINK